MIEQQLISGTLFVPDGDSLVINAKTVKKARPIINAFLDKIEKGDAPEEKPVKSVFASVDKE